MQWQRFYQKKKETVSPQPNTQSLKSRKITLCNPFSLSLTKSDISVKALHFCIICRSLIDSSSYSTCVSWTENNPYSILEKRLEEMKD